MNCLYPGCSNTRRSRGLCHQHTTVLSSMRRKGAAASDADLMRRGLLLAKGTGGAPRVGQARAFERGSKLVGQEFGEAVLAGRRVLVVRAMEIEEAQAEGWDRLVTSMYWPPPVIELDGGLLMYPSKDPVGNGFGALFGRSSDGKRLMFGVPAAARETA